jgi:hypothetical protein
LTSVARVEFDGLLAPLPLLVLLLLRRHLGGRRGGLGEVEAVDRVLRLRLARLLEQHLGLALRVGVEAAAVVQVAEVEQVARALRPALRDRGVEERLRPRRDRPRRVGGFDLGRERLLRLVGVRGEARAAEG